MELAGGSNGRIKPRHHDPVHGHCPSVDVLFRAVAGLGRSALSAILTSIAPDGAEELLGSGSWRCDLRPVPQNLRRLRDTMLRLCAGHGWKRSKSVRDGRADSRCMSQIV